MRHFVVRYFLRGPVCLHGNVNSAQYGWVSVRLGSVCFGYRFSSFFIIRSARSEAIKFCTVRWHIWTYNYRNVKWKRIWSRMERWNSVQSRSSDRKLARRTYDCKLKYFWYVSWQTSKKYVAQISWNNKKSEVTLTCLFLDWMSGTCVVLNTA